VKKEDELIAKAKAGKLVERAEKVVPEKGPGVRTFNVFVDEEYYKVDVETTGGAPVVTLSAAPKTSVSLPSPPPATKEPPKVEQKKASSTAVAEGVRVLAPMPGMIIRHLVNVGDEIKAGDPVVVLEAMKMQNIIPSPVDGTVMALNFGPGDSVQKDSILVVIA